MSGLIIFLIIVLLFVIGFIFVNFKYINSDVYKAQFSQVKKFSDGVPQNIQYAYFGSTHTYFDFNVGE
jgi:hypothetical protein